MVVPPDPERPWIRDADNAWPLANPHQVNAIRRISITGERKVGYLGTHGRAVLPAEGNE